MHTSKMDYPGTKYRNAQGDGFNQNTGIITVPEPVMYLVPGTWYSTTSGRKWLLRFAGTQIPISLIIGRIT